MSKIVDSYSVSELNEFIRDVVKSGFPQPVWLCGEIQGYDRQKTKNHIFFQLLEKDETKNVKAVIDLVIWAGKKPMIEQVLARSEAAFELKDDIEVKFLCTVDFYPPHGRVRLVVENIDPFYTLGKLAQEKQKLIADLKKAGLLDRNKALTMSTVPLNIGLITSHDSAAYNDFISELKHSGFGFKVFVRNTLMQGKASEKDVSQAIIELNRKKDLDIIVITRGGGSMSDLSCFDSELIAKTVAASEFPVLCGIGHEIDLTVTDLAAHAYAKTPTAIAQFIIGKVENFINDLGEKEDRLVELVEAYFTDQSRYLHTQALRLQNSARGLFKEHHEKMIRYHELLKWKPEALIKSAVEDLKSKKEAVVKGVQFRLTNGRNQLKGYQKMVDIASPVNTMKRGFTITRNSEGKIIRSKKDIKTNMNITTQVVDGSFDSRVNE